MSKVQGWRAGHVARRAGPPVVSGLTLALDILTAIGLGAACGLRPFVPALAAGGLAAANATIDFDGTGYSFLEAPGWLLAVTAALVLTVLAARFIPEYGLWVASLVIGVLCAVLAAAVPHDLFGRVRARLDAQAAGALPLYAEAAALVLAVAAVLAPPLSIVAVGFLAWLLLGGRRRSGEKFAGLRVLR